MYMYSGLQIFFQDWWAEVTHGAKNGGSFSEMMGPRKSNGPTALKSDGPYFEIMGQ